MQNRQPETGPVDVSRPEDLNLVVDVGDQRSEEGLTRVTLEGSGMLSVEQLHDPSVFVDRQPQSKRLSTEVGRDHAARILGTVSRLQWDQRFPPRPGIPDEAVVVFRLVSKAGAWRTVKMWLRDAEEDKTAGPVLGDLRQEVDRLSGGELFL